MARGIQESDVWAAADALLLEGQRPTIERVRLKIGRGSPNTVQPLLDTWFRGLGARITDPKVFAAPADVPDPVAQAAKHFWEVALATARKDFDEKLREGLDAAAANVEAEKEKATIAESAAFSAAAKATQSQKQLESVQAALDAERLNQAATAARAEAAEKRSRELLSEVQLAGQATTAERARADRAIAAADERAAGAERRAAMEIERERGLRAKAEKELDAVGKRLVVATQSERKAIEELATLQARHQADREQATQRELVLSEQEQAHLERIADLEAQLAQSKAALLQSSGQEALVQQIVARFDEAVKHPPNKPVRKHRRKETSAN